MQTETSVLIDEPVTHPRENNLFPIFLKLEQLRLLIVGGGNVGLEKLQAVLKNAPATPIKLVAPYISLEIKEVAAAHPNVWLLERPYASSDLMNTDLVIAAVDDLRLSDMVSKDAKNNGILINVADTPAKCDFYLGAIVKKGNLKIAISTNGQSPTIAKRLKTVLDESLPAEMNDLLDNMHHIRNRLKGNFSEKVAQLNELTKDLILDAPVNNKKAENKWKKIAGWLLFAFFFIFIGNLISYYFTIGQLGEGIMYIGSKIETKFYWMILAGFFAQLVDGALGMGYGVTCTSILLAIGIPLPAISGSIHTAEMFSSGASGFSHYKFGNVNKKLFKIMLAPGILGAVAGAYLLSKYGEDYSRYFRPLLAAYTLLLGVKILLNAFKKNKRTKRLKWVGWLAATGGFLDSFGGGGWGPLVTSTLISKGKTPRYVIGTVSITEFFVTLASAITFFSMIGISHWQVIAGLIVGGMVGAPIAAKLAGKLPLKTMFIAVGSLVIFWSLNVLIKALF